MDCLNSTVEARHSGSGCVIEQRTKQPPSRASTEDDAAWRAPSWASAPMDTPQVLLLLFQSPFIVTYILCGTFAATVASKSLSIGPRNVRSSAVSIARLGAGSAVARRSPAFAGRVADAADLTESRGGPPIGPRPLLTPWRGRGARARFFESAVSGSAKAVLFTVEAANGALAIGATDLPRP
jgi:hypothetical protein